MRFCISLTLQDRMQVYLRYTLSQIGQLVIFFLCSAQNTPMNFAIARGVLPSMRSSEMKKIHGWQSLRDGFLAVVVGQDGLRKYALLLSALVKSSPSDVLLLQFSFRFLVPIDLVLCSHSLLLQVLQQGSSRAPWSCCLGCCGQSLSLQCYFAV